MLQLVVNESTRVGGIKKHQEEPCSGWVCDTFSKISTSIGRLLRPNQNILHYLSEYLTLLVVDSHITVNCKTKPSRITVD
jgi:hypothetical protein